MAVVEMCCLANSRKMSARCVAGIDWQAERWVRPVTALEYRVLQPQHYQLPPPHLSTQVLDTVRLKLDHPTPEQHHPEDHLLGATPWQLVARPSTPADIRALHDRLEPYLITSPIVFDTVFDRIPFDSLAEKPVSASLGIIRPDRVTFTIDIRGDKRRYRTHFTSHFIRYDLSLTDPVWSQRLAALKPGEYAPAELGVIADDIWLVLSLGEPFQGDCYKLVATVLAWQC